MALTISDAGNGTSITNDTTCATGATVTASVGDWLVVVVAAANAGASGASSISAPSDASGNTYTQRAIINFTPGSVASDGATLGFYTAAITSALSSAAVTANFSANTPQKSVQVYRVQPGVGESVQFVATDGTGSTGLTGTHAAATVSVTNGDTIFGAAAIETDDIITGDSDTTNGNWSSILTRVADGGGDTDCMTCSSQYKTVNATGNQSWACTSASRDSARTYLIIGPIASGITLTADAGSYAITGQTASLEYGREVAADGGGYAFTGTAANLEYGREVAADAGSYSISGQDATLNRGKTVAADGGAYTFTGTSASLVWTHKITVDAGSYTINGTAASLEYGREVVATFGSYIITGADVSFIQTGPATFELGLSQGASLTPSLSVGASLSGTISGSVRLTPGVNR
jgi:hypothetical protein